MAYPSVSLIIFKITKKNNENFLGISTLKPTIEVNNFLKIKKLKP